jgi:ATP-dependent DNA ligase
LIERKRLRAILPRENERIMYCDHVEAAGEELFQLACQNDLEGIVAKRKFDPVPTRSREMAEDPKPELQSVARPRRII